MNRKQIQKMLDGNWSHSGIGKIEQMSEEIELLQKTLSTLLEILLKKDVITKRDLLKKFEEGWKITYE